MISDLNKEIISIQYDNNNLPISIIFKNNCRIDYYYDALGTLKLQTVTKEGILMETTDFAGNFVYINGKPAWNNFDEGRVVYTVSGPCFIENYLKDHLGNVRVAYSSATDGTVLSVKQVNTYYPFGMSINSLTSTKPDKVTKNEYLYNGKMFQDELGLNWYNYAARFYDPQIGRWHAVDPSAEKMRRWGTYTFCFDNPVRFLDLDGRKPGDLFGTIVGAARDFGNTYNGASISRSKEYGSSIYVVQKDGKVYYTYTEPNRGKNASVSCSPSPQGSKTVADIHSHGSYEEGFDNNNFSNIDKWSNYNKKINGYLTTPDGSLMKYDYMTAETTTLSTNLPSDPNDPERKNENAPTDKQQVEAGRLLVNRKISQEREGIRKYKDETTSNSSTSWSQIMQTLNSWLSQNPNIVVTIR